MRRVDVLRRGPERVRVGPWRGDHSTAHLAPVGEAPALTHAMVQHCCEVLAERGFQRVVTGALAVAEQGSFLDDGFVVQEELHLLAHDLSGLPATVTSPTGTRMVAGHRWHRARTLAVDTLAFPPFWRLDGAGFEEAMRATPQSRFRIVRAGPVVGYAITGRAGTRGYLQRLAVAPQLAGRGIGTALVLDALRWMRSRRVHRAVVNTQVANERALALYLRLGFRLQPSGLAVLTRSLGDRQPAP